MHSCVFSISSFEKANSWLYLKRWVMICNIRDAWTFSCRVSAMYWSLWRAVYWRAAPFPCTLQNESKTQMTLWGQWLTNKLFPPFPYRWLLIFRKIRAASCVDSLLLCLSLLNTLENDLRLLWVLTISSSRHCAKALAPFRIPAEHVWVKT